MFTASDKIEGHFSKQFEYKYPVVKCTFLCLLQPRGFRRFFGTDTGINAVLGAEAQAQGLYEFKSVEQNRSHLEASTW